MIITWSLFSVNRTLVMQGISSASGSYPRAIRKWPWFTNDRSEESNWYALWSVEKWFTEDWKRSKRLSCLRYLYGGKSWQLPQDSSRSFWSGESHWSYIAKSIQADKNEIGLSTKSIFLSYFFYYLLNTLISIRISFFHRIKIILEFLFRDFFIMWIEKFLNITVV